jgi:hypothetical protein
MPSGWNAGDHHVKYCIDDGVETLRCKCGWALALDDEVARAPGEPWRDIARAHVDAFPTTDPAVLWAQRPWPSGE